MALLRTQGGGPRDGQFDDKVFSETGDSVGVNAALEGRWVRAARRKGKQIWLELSTDAAGPTVSCLLMHFGMTGAVIIRGVEAPTYKNFSIETLEWPPRFTKLELYLADAAGACQCTLAYLDPRRFGR